MKFNYWINKQEYIIKVLSKYFNFNKKFYEIIFLKNVFLDLYLDKVRLIWRGCCLSDSELPD
jgi:hypothetical protein